MRILYIYRNPNMGFSIGKVFKPIEEEMKKYAEVDSVYLPVPNYSLKGLWRNIKAARKVERKKKYDVVHITGAEHYLIPFLTTKQVVVTVHDLGFYFNEKKKLNYPIKHLLFVYVLKLARRVTFISKKSEDECLRAVNLNQKKRIVINNPYNPAFIYVERSFNTACPRILHIGTKPNKNLNNVIEALSGIPCVLRIIGKVDDKGITRMNELGVNYSISDNLTDGEIIKEYQMCDIVCFPSLYEGYGMPIIEGQASGRVVLTSRIPPMDDVAGDGAIFVAPQSVESIRKGFLDIIENAELRNTLIVKGFKNIERFRLSSITKVYYALYKDMIS